MIAARVICIAIGYVLGMFQTGYLYGKLHHVDIRQISRRSKVVGIVCRFRGSSWT